MPSVWDEFDDTVTTGRGRKALARLKELDVLSREAERIERAVAEGLLPRVTPEQAKGIAAGIARSEEYACIDLDSAEGFR